LAFVKSDDFIYYSPILIFKAFLKCVAAIL